MALFVTNYELSYTHHNGWEVRGEITVYLHIRGEYEWEVLSIELSH